MNWIRLNAGNIPKGQVVALSLLTPQGNLRDEPIVVTGHIIKVDKSFRCKYEIAGKCINVAGITHYSYIPEFDYDRELWKQKIKDEKD